MGLFDDYIQPSVMNQNPQGIMSQPTAAVLPPAPAAPQSRFQQILAKLMPVNAGMAGLLTPDDMKSARRQGLLNFGLSMLANSRGQGAGNAPGLGQALAASYGAGRNAFEGDIEKSAQGNVGGMQTANMLRLLDSRQKIGQQFAPLPNETHEQLVNRLMQMFHAHAAAGDTEMVGRLSDVIGKLGTDHAPPRREPFKVETGDGTELFDPDTWQHVGTIPRRPAPKSADEVGAANRFQAGEKNKILDDFRADTKDFQKVMEGWDVLKGATKDPSLATPFAVTDAYARITNPGGIVRPTTMEMIHDMGSIGQRMQKWWDQHANGSLPPDILADFQHTLYNIVREHKNHFDRVRSQSLSRARQSNVPNLESLLTDYPLEDLSGRGTSGASGGASGAINPMTGKPRNQ